MNGEKVRIYKEMCYICTGQTFNMARNTVKERYQTDQVSNPVPPNTSLELHQIPTLSKYAMAKNKVLSTTI
jgi:hypothetical protein